MVVEDFDVWWSRESESGVGRGGGEENKYRARWGNLVKERHLIGQWLSVLALEPQIEGPNNGWRFSPEICVQFLLIFSL